MEKNLLKRECDFYKLNEEIESRTQGLFEEVENVMREKETSNEPLEISANSTLAKSPTPPDFLLARTSRGESDCERPGFDPDIRPQTALHLLQIQYQALEKEKVALQAELKAQAERLKKSRSQMQQAQEDHNKVQQQADALHKSNKKQQLQIVELNNLIGIKDTDAKSLRKEVEALARQIKQASQERSSDRVKLSRAHEELDKLKSALKAAGSDERDVKEVSRRENLQLRATIQSLEKQKSELMFGVKKQYLLIDNLKQQMLQTSVSRFVQYSEDEFSSILDEKMEEKPRAKPAGVQKSTNKTN